jgi:hypothetical protein
MTRPTTVGRVPTWRPVRHYAYVDRPFEAVCATVAEAPHRVLDAQPRGGNATITLRTSRDGLEVSRRVTIRIGGLFGDDRLARMALRWCDGRDANVFPIFEGTLSLEPLRAGRQQVTRVGLVGRYRSPLGVAEVAEDVVAAVLDGIARRLERIIDPSGPDGSDSQQYSQVLVAMDGRAARREGLRETGATKP